MNCPNCGQENRETARFCGKCAAPLGGETPCPQCGTANPAGQKFCDGCAHPMAAKDAPPEEPATPEAERRQLTVMFCDLVASTELSKRLDPEDLGEVIRLYREVCAEVAGRYDQEIAGYLGDALLVYFGYPTAHEDDPVRGVRAGLEILEELPRLNAEVQQRIPALRDPRRYIEAFEAITGRAFEPSIEEPMAWIRRNLGNFSSEKFDNSERS